MYWLALAALLCATVTDLRKREIPNGVSLLLILSAVVAKVSGWHVLTWGELLGGCVLAFLAGALLFRLGALGGGDVKLLSAFGTVLGPLGLLPFLLATSILGGVFALVARRKGETEIAYAPAMLGGLLALLPVVWLSS